MTLHSTSVREPMFRLEYLSGPPTSGGRLPIDFERLLGRTPPAELPHLLETTGNQPFAQRVIDKYFAQSTGDVEIFSGLTIMAASRPPPEASSPKR